MPERKINKIFWFFTLAKKSLLKQLSWCYKVLPAISSHVMLPLYSILTRRHDGCKAARALHCLSWIFTWELCKILQSPNMRMISVGCYYWQTKKFAVNYNFSIISLTFLGNLRLWSKNNIIVKKWAYIWAYPASLPKLTGNGESSRINLMHLVSVVLLTKGYYLQYSHFATKKKQKNIYITFSIF